MDGVCLWTLRTVSYRRRRIVHRRKDLRVGWTRVHMGEYRAEKPNSYYYPGTFQQYAIAPAHYATPIPDGVPSDLAAPLLCGGVTVYAALKKLIDEGGRPGDWVVIPGESWTEPALRWATCFDASVCPATSSETNQGHRWWRRAWSPCASNWLSRHGLPHDRN
jgi:hypothetical protein